MKQRGLHWVAAFEELDALRPATRAILGFQLVLELVGGTLLMASGIGGIFTKPLFAAAFYDAIAFAKSRFLRKFSWTTYCLGKPLGIALSFVLAAVKLGASDGTPRPAFIDRLKETFSSLDLFGQAVGSVALDGFLTLLATSSGYLADYAYKEERSLISEKVREMVTKYLEAEPEMQHLLASFCALESFAHGNGVIPISSPSELQFRLWLKSAGAGVSKSWKSKLLKYAELWLTQQGIKKLGHMNGSGSFLQPSAC